MNNLLTETLKDVIKSNKDNEYVFCHKDGKPYYGVRKSFDKALKEDGRMRVYGRKKKSSQIIFKNKKGCKSNVIKDGGVAQLVRAAES